MWKTKAQSFTKARQSQVRFEMDINDHKNRITRMNRNSVITSLTCDDMWNNSSIREEVLMDADGRSSCVQIIRFKCAKESELREQKLNSLEEFILPVNFLKANDIIILSKPRKRDVFLFSGHWKWILMEVSRLRSGRLSEKKKLPNNFVAQTSECS